MIRIDVHVSDFRKIFTELEEEQLPFAASLALNNTMKGAQQAQWEGMRQRFTIRDENFLRYPVKIPRFSTKRDQPISAEIRIDRMTGSEGGIKAGRGDAWEKFEQGGSKRSRVGKFVAVPITARSSRNAIVPDPLRPQNLNLHAVGKAIRGDQRTFRIPLKSGKRGIFQRVGPGKGDVRLLYLLTPIVPIPASLRFDQTIREFVEELWAINFEEAFEIAMRTAK